MKWLLLVCGLVVGSICTFAGMTYLHQSLRQESDQIVFAEKNFFDAEQAGVSDYVSMSGTLMGEGMAYPNNTYSVGCIRQQGICLVSSVEQIGRQQVGRMDGPWWYPIVKWDQSEIVAAEEPSTVACVKVTITIDRRQKSLLWLEEPSNQNRPSCQKSNTNIRKFTIEDSPGWKKIFGSNSG